MKKDEDIIGGMTMQMELFPDDPGGEVKRKPGRPSTGVPRAEQLRRAAKRHYQKKKESKETA
ncbi:MAG: hypothetical protein WAW41_06975 [Methylobacter sp.]